jgi:uncharacterized LabA/DUF88 family protein
MFTPKTSKLEALVSDPALQKVVDKLSGLFVGKTNVYIDYANVRPWSEKLGWHIAPNRLKQFLKSFDNVGLIKFYQGELVGDPRSQSEIKKLRECRFEVRTKPVKIMRHSIDTTSISKQSPDLLRKFIRGSLLRIFSIGTVEYLNKKFEEMNTAGVFYIEDRKCNFDVEIGTDMRVDHLKDGIETFVLWSGDSDFADPIRTLLAEGKRVVLFATAGRVARELNDLVKEGLFIFDIFELREFICWVKEQ